MKNKETKKLVKLIAFLVAILFVELIVTTVCAQVISPKPLQSNVQGEEDSNEMQESESQPYEQLRKVGCDCSSYYAGQLCQNQNRNFGC